MLTMIHSLLRSEVFLLSYAAAPYSVIECLDTRRPSQRFRVSLARQDVDGRPICTYLQ